MRRYKLVGQAVMPLLGSVAEDDIEIASDEIGGVVVCTKFLGYSLSNADPPPDVFETMVYKNPPPYPTWRCATGNEATRVHAEVVAQVRRQSMRVVP